MPAKLILLLPLCGFLSLLTGQEAATPPDPAASPWSIHFQATSIGQHHGSFPSPYEGANSLPPHPESLASLTATVFLSYRLNHHIEFVVNPEVAGGKGFGGVAGIAGFTNGEIPRVAGATPTLYPARAFVHASWDLDRPKRSFSVIAGKFAVTDYFDNNTYSHDPRKQFMNWALMYNGAWDYPADTRGYTVGLLEELTLGNASLRAAQVAEPTMANGPDYDTRFARNQGDEFEWEQRYKPLGRPGALRVLGFAHHEHGGTYREALLSDGTVDLASTRRNGTLKYGFGLNLEQSVTPDIGIFVRYGWSDGKTETWAFTEIDRSVSGGVSVQGKLWRRGRDHVGAGAARNFLSGDHRNFLAHGGLGFIIGDGRLDHYRPEAGFEAYYACGIVRDWTVTFDYQHIQNPAYNADRGPVSVLTLRLHWER